MAQTIGVCAIQGDFEKHLIAIQRIGRGDIFASEVRTPEELALVDKLILPGGESTTVGLLMQRFGLGEAIVQRAQSGMPIWGTCMGMILLATDIEDRPAQWSLGLLDCTVRRNAFGAQVHSFERQVEFKGFEPTIIGVFIRAPVVTRLGTDVEALAAIDGQSIAVRQGNVLGTSFHPELTSDTRVHDWFASW